MKGNSTMTLLFIGALVLLVAAVFTYTQSEDAGFGKAKAAFQTLDGELKSLTNSLNKFTETCEDLTAKFDSVKSEVQELKDKQAKIDERLITAKTEQKIMLETRPVSVSPIQVELITRQAPLLERAGVVQPPKVPAGKPKNKTKGERRLTN